MGERDGATKVSAAAAQPPRPTISVPPPASFETLFGGGSVPGFSPGPMTLVSSMFSPDSSCCSFSQLLAGAMASPIAKPAFLAPESNLSENRPKEVNPADGSDKRMGYKQNRPMGLMVAQSPLLLVPPGLSPSGFLNSPGFLSPLLSPFGMSHQQALAHVTAQAAFSQSFLQMQAGHQHSSIVASTETLEPQPSSVPGETLQQHLDNVPSEPQCLKMELSEATQSDKKPTARAVDKPADDGYNWRKYGRKLVKAKEHPRSYYKCTHLNCPVKKKVEWAPDGHITEITYKGQHNHEVPQPNIQAKDRSNAGTMNSRGKPEFGLKSQTEMDALNEIEASNLGVRKQKAPTQLSSGQLPVNSEHDEMEDSAIVIDEENADDEPNAKKRSRKVGACVPTITEPKIVVQTRSEVDLLDDGYKWRKYGQKVVKGNPHPRSYYRCTYAGCNVRKHVERASTDPKAVITTYEGKHNHHTPTGRNNSQSIADSASMRLKPQKVAARKLSIDRGMDFDNKDQMQVLSQLKEGEIAA